MSKKTTSEHVSDQLGLLKRNLVKNVNQRKIEKISEEKINKLAKWEDKKQRMGLNSKGLTSFVQDKKKAHVIPVHYICPSMLCVL